MLDILIMKEEKRNDKKSINYSLNCDNFYTKSSKKKLNKLRKKTE
jgi:hypothetical protein